MTAKGGPAAAVSLRRATPDDAPAFARLMGDPRVYAGLMQLPYPDVDAWRKRLAEGGHANDATLSLVAEVAGEAVGSAGLHPCLPVRRRHVAMLGISVAAEWQRRGVGSALMRALCDHADRWAQLLRLELTVFADNAPAIALYRKHGFEVEGTHRGFGCATAPTPMRCRWRGCTRRNR